MNQSSTSKKGKITPVKQTSNDAQHLDVRMSDIIKTLPVECFEKKEGKAWFLVAANILVVILGVYSIAVLPWYFLPVTWIITGTGLAGFFTIGHDCGHYTFSKKRELNDIVGHIFMLPLLYPFYGWCVEHNCHHTRTNKLGGGGWRQIHELLNGKTDPNWQPFRVEAYNFLKPKNRFSYRLMRSYLWWTGTITNWWHRITFDDHKMSLKEQNKVNLSKTIVFIFALILFPTLIFTVGWWGLIKFWLIPWLIYHFWFSTFTLIHHTSPKTKWKVNSHWNAAQANLSGTVHCDYPWWVEFLCHDINYHVPHHLSTAIPFYNLRKAHRSLRENWSPYLQECRFSLSLISQITSQCHLYDSEKESYISFNEL